MAGGELMCMIDDDETWECSSTKHPRARTEHHCGECGRTIGRGETYMRVTGLYEGHFDVFKTCAHCEAAAQWLVKVCHGYLTNGVLEDLEEHWNEWELRHYWLGRYILSIRRKWRTGSGDLMPVPAIHLPPKFLAVAA